MYKIRRQEPEDAVALHEVYSQPNVIWGTTKLQVYTDNERGVRLYERCDFEIEGTLKDFSFRDGEYVDVFAMARLR